MQATEPGRPAVADRVAASIGSAGAALATCSEKHPAVSMKRGNAPGSTWRDAGRDDVRRSAVTPAAKLLGQLPQP